MLQRKPDCSCSCTAVLSRYAAELQISSSTAIYSLTDTVAIDMNEVHDAFVASFTVVKDTLGGHKKPQSDSEEDIVERFLSRMMPLPVQCLDAHEDETEEISWIKEEQRD